MAVALLGIGAGCSLVRPAPIESVDPAQEARLRSLEDWEVRGRIAVKAEGRGAQGNLRWQQLKDDARIQVSGPFGAGAYDIRWTPERLTVTGRDGALSADYEGPDAAEQFLAAQLGWSFPVVSTRYWLLGLADPSTPAELAKDAAGRVVRLEQHGWTITYEEFVRQAGLWLPRKLALENERGRLRLVLDAWSF